MASQGKKTRAAKGETCSYDIYTRMSRGRSGYCGGLNRGSEPDWTLFTMLLPRRSNFLTSFTPRKPIFIYIKLFLSRQKRKHFICFKQLAVIQINEQINQYKRHEKCKVSPENQASFCCDHIFSSNLNSGFFCFPTFAVVEQ